MTILREIVEVRALTSRSRGVALAWLALLIVNGPRGWMGRTRASPATAD
jgi:hypothetical protein